ncbi:MAG: methylenetetrahydrofolate--tRNA-(uracil(54)-C(5))-methyltransferase (FADH(2)-oxidizing) TrmFO, partial [Intestinibacter sp.]
MKKYINVIGGGLAGSEAAYQIAKQGIKVKLYEMKPTMYSPAHSNQNLAEVVCSNSFKSNLHTNACGLLKEELRKLDSLLIRIADEVSVPAGQALAVDREEFSKRVTEELEKMKEIEIIRKEVGNQTVNNVDDILLDEGIKGELESMAEDGIVIIATGPLTSNSLSKEIATLTGEDKLYFYDAAAPIIEKDSINMNIAFWGERYEQEREKEETEE